MNDFFQHVLDVLRRDERFFSDDGTFLRNAVFEAAMTLDNRLLTLLLEDDLTREKFFTDAAGVKVFDKLAFAWTINNRQFLPDSYTRFANKIGLADADDFISATNKIALVFPYKDCVLEGGQTRDDIKRDEIFYNTMLAPDAVDCLLEPKVLVNATRYTADGSAPANDFTDADNLIVKGNNLLALASLTKRFTGRVKLIYIDPPYNTGSDSFGYNDRFRRSTWLVFMKNRLELARRLLRHDGLIFIHLDYNQSHYAKVLLDEIFGESNFVNEIIWRRKQAVSFGKSKFGIINDSIFVYSKSNEYDFYPIYSLDDENTKSYIAERFIFDDHDGRGRYMKSPLVNSLDRPNLKYVFHGINPPPKGWLYSQAKMEQLFANGEIIIPDNPNARLYRKIYLSSYEGQVVQNIWLDIPIVNPMAKEQQNFPTQKPEALLERILKCCTVKGDLVLDYHVGSGTTAAVAHKMGRRYIGVEQMNYIRTLTVERLVKVIGGEGGGISGRVGWTGGGSFVYCELASLNQKFVDAIECATDNATLSTILKQMLATGFISHKVDPAKIEASADEFAALTLDGQKRFLLELLDKNLLYVNLSDLDDAEFAVADSDKQFTRSFYFNSDTTNPPTASVMAPNPTTAAIVRL